MLFDKDQTLDAEKAWEQG